MTKWVWKGIKTGIKTGDYPGKMENTAGISPGRPINTQFDREKKASALAKRCPADALRSFSNEVMVNYEKCISCFRCKHNPFSENNTNDNSKVNSATINGRNSTKDSGDTGDNTNIDNNNVVINWKNDYEWAFFTEKGSPLPKSVFSGSLHLRIVDGGACGACMGEIKQITSPYYNIHRFGFFITPTPRMADILLVAGPLTEHMADSLENTWKAMPSPKRVIAIGTCAVSGGMFRKGFAVKGGIGSTIPVDIVVPGCPPPPLAIVHALLMAAGKKVDPTSIIAKNPLNGLSKKSGVNAETAKEKRDLQQ